MENHRQRQHVVGCMITTFLIMSLPISAIASPFRASLRHVDAGKSIPEKLSNAVARSERRIESIKHGMAIHGRQLGTNSYTTQLQYAVEEYLMEVEVGTPAKKFTAILDTGSDLIWFKCGQCTACSGTSCESCPPTVLDSAQSTSFATIACDSAQCGPLPSTNCSGSESCKYHYSYLDQSYNDGEYASETLSLLYTSGLSEQFNVTLGCAHAISGDFSGADGLVGFSLTSPSFISQATPLNGKFSYCLTSYTLSNDSSLLLGDSSVISDPSASSTPILQSSVGYYYVLLHNITVGNTVIYNSTNPPTADLNPQHTIFDSGTTYTYLDQTVYSSVIAAFSSALHGVPLVTYNNFDCFNMSAAPSVQFPSLSFQFDGASMQPPEENYLAYADAAHTIRCLLLQPEADGQGIIGNIMQQNYLIAHDTVGMTLSFLKTDCTTI